MSSCVHALLTEVALDACDVTPLGLGLGKLSIPLTMFPDGHRLVNPTVVLMCFHDAFHFAIRFGLTMTVAFGTFFAEVLMLSASCDV